MRRLLTFLIASALLMSMLVGPVSAQTAGSLEPGGTFLDDDGSVHEGAIEALVAAGVTTGCSTSPSFYCPGRTVTRGEMAVFLQRAFGYPTPEVGDFFTDDDATPYESAIDAIAAAGITIGCDTITQRYCPDASVSRQEMASFLVRALAPGEFDAPPDAFSDDEGSVHEADIDRLALLGITNGCGPGLFCPLAGVSRAEMASFLARALGLPIVAPPPRPAPVLVSSFTTFHDCCEPRVHNIHVIADQIDGAVVYPGQTFSINQHTGPRTADKGYVAAPILLEGEGFCCAIGGGTSQFGTTFYNAVFWAGLEIVEHKPHSRYLDRYPLGIEATLGYPSLDVVFRNDTNAPIVIHTGYTGTSITVEVWGDNDGRAVVGRHRPGATTIDVVSEGADSARWVTADVTGSATFSGGGSVKVVRTVTESGVSSTQTWFWTYLSG